MYDHPHYCIATGGQRDRDTYAEVDLEFSFDDLFVCGDCKRVVTDEFRPDPRHSTMALERNMGSKAEVPVCNVCEENIGKSESVNAMSCLSCIAHCNECDDLLFHKSCLPYHEINCSMQSRAERALRLAEQSITTTESDLRKAKSYLSRIQHDVTSLERKLAQAEETKAKAQRDLQSEADNDNSYFNKHEVDG
jgi:hypothetical protein